MCTADGKGVPMRGARCASGGASPRMRPGTKKMALIGAVYTVDLLIVASGGAADDDVGNAVGFRRGSRLTTGPRLVKPESVVTPK